ncbi:MULTISPECIES: DUF6783 domain-containing protein [Blautia]|nr:DUF6783 domain-containing protein [uncultured Blautia sp.]
MGGKYAAEWGVQIVGMHFQTRSRGYCNLDDTVGVQVSGRPGLHRH